MEIAQKIDVCPFFSFSLVSGLGLNTTSWNWLLELRASSMLSTHLQILAKEKTNITIRLTSRKVKMWRNNILKEHYRTDWFVKKQE